MPTRMAVLFSDHVLLSAKITSYSIVSSPSDGGRWTAHGVTISN